MTAPTLIATQTTRFTAIPQWQQATWEDYLAYRDNPTPERVRLFFNGNYLFVDMGSEGINHASFGDLFAMLFFIWFSRFPKVTLHTQHSEFWLYHSDHIIESVRFHRHA